MSSTEIILASQARYVNHYRNLQSKVMKCCANIYFTRQCLKQIWVVFDEVYILISF